MRGKSAKSAKEKLRSSSDGASSLGSHIPVGKTIPALILRVRDVTGKAGMLSCQKLLPWKRMEKKNPHNDSSIDQLFKERAFKGRVFRG